ncbi:hypothetical protein GF407_20385 [candidate division KSB1 bacterium]|nr:hypothetical protein [candidate division KSB1 bacterium]
MSRKSAFLAAAIMLLCSASALMGADFVIVNNDAAGEGLNDPTAVTPVGGNSGTTLGQQRLIVLQMAADVWGEILQSDIQILVGANFDTLPGNATSAVLGSAGAAGNVAGGALPRSNTWYPYALASSLLGYDVNTNNVDINARFNSAVDGDDILGTVHWYYGLDGNRGSDIDLFTTVLHELAHGLGFQTLVDLETGTKPNNYDDCFMVHLEDHSRGETWPEMDNIQRAASATDTDDLHWVGTVVSPLYYLYSDGIGAGNHFEMYAPDPLQQGSSVAHWDKDLTPDELMEPSYTGFKDNPGLTVELMQDLGWQLNAKLSIRLFLEGAWDSDNGNMRTDLYQGADLPLTSPYDEDPLSVTSIPDSVVDWVLVELRSTAEGAAVAQNSAFISRNGYITESGEEGGVILNVDNDDYYVVVRHRNHVDVMSATTTALAAGSTASWDFSSAATQFYGVAGGKNLQGDVWGMAVGDINSDGYVTSMDYSRWYNADHLNLNGYSDSDCNLDGSVDTADYLLWQSNAATNAQSRLP